MASQIGQVSTENSSQQLLELLRKMEELYVSDTPETVERTVWEFTEMAKSHTLTTSDLRKMLNSIFETLANGGTTANMATVALNIVAEANRLPYRYYVQPYGVKRWRIWAQMT